MRKLALSGLVAVAAVLGSAIPAVASTVATPKSAAAAAAAHPQAAATIAATGLGGRISCATPTACLAVGADVNSAGNSTPIAEVLHGTTWKSVPVKSPGGSVSTELSGVSCKAANYCLVDGDYTNKAGLDLPYVLTWNGTALTAIVKAPLPSGDELTTMGGVSCVAVKSCVVFGSAASATSLNGAVQLAWTWNGSKWGRKTAGSGGSLSEEFTAAQCFTLTSCLEAGNVMNASGTESELLATWNGSSLTTQPIPAPARASIVFPSDLSCSSSHNCAVVGFGLKITTGTTSTTSNPGIFGLAQVWDGSTWKAVKWTGPKGANLALLLGVSCTSANNCVAVGASGTNNSGAAASFTWNGTHWAAVAVPSVGKGLTTEFSSVSCPSAGHCEAIGGYGPPTATNGKPLAGSLHGGSWRLQHA